MRILHFADLHLGVENYGRTDPATGLSSRLVEFLTAFDELVEYAIRHEVDLVLFCGDAYKTRDPSQTQQREFARRIALLAASGIKVFLLVGNHDLPNAIGRATSLDIFDTLSIKNVIVGNGIDAYRIENRSGDLQIVALPWVGRSMLLTRDEVKNLTLEQLNQRIEELIVEQLEKLVRDLDPALPTILAGHVSLASGRIGAERSLVIGRDNVLHQGRIPLPAFDYIALGHLHSHQVLSLNPPIVYSGSLQPIDFNEENEEKGFCVIELEKGKAHYEFHPVKTRRFVTIEVNANAEDPTAAVRRAIGKKDIKDAIVRLHIKVSPERAGLIQDSEVRQILEEAHFVAAVVKEVEREVRNRLETYSAEEITPLEGLRAYLKTRDLSPERSSVLLNYGEKIIREHFSSDATLHV
ncbi:exonuclease SbcCD subunit D [Dehalococcoidia bacterium]|nr:exonuclease SbcCD subunit D [Dehalococcoidia bacterium]